MRMDNTLINGGKKVFKIRYLSHVRGKQQQLQTQFKMRIIGMHFVMGF